MDGIQRLATFIGAALRATNIPHIRLWGAVLIGLAVTVGIEYLLRRSPAKNPKKQTEQESNTLSPDEPKS